LSSVKQLKYNLHQRSVLLSSAGSHLNPLIKGEGEQQDRKPEWFLAYFKVLNF
jgi:hypothetical protein